MRFAIEINLDNAAFDDDREGELARILEKLAQFVCRDYQLDDGLGVPWMVFDINGNMIGSATVTQ